MVPGILKIYLEHFFMLFGILISFRYNILIDLVIQNWIYQTNSFFLLPKVALQKFKFDKWTKLDQNDLILILKSNRFKSFNPDNCSTHSFSRLWGQGHVKVESFIHLKSKWFWSRRQYSILQFPTIFIIKAKSRSTYLKIWCWPSNNHKDCNYLASSLPCTFWVKLF